MEEKRHRGGQKGNHNAVKHGYYSRELNKEQRLDFNVAAGMEGIEEEIALLRFKIKQSVTTGDIADLIPLSRITYALEKLIRTNQKLFAPKNNYVNGMRKLLGELMVQDNTPNHVIGVLAHRQYPDEFPPVPSPYDKPKTDNSQNESALP